MTDAPLCQFGPGGDYAYAWPESEKPYVVSSGEMIGESVALEADTLGLVPPLVSLGPGGLQWIERPGGREDVGIAQADRLDSAAAAERPSSVLARALGALGRMLIGSAPGDSGVLAAGSAPIEDVAMSGRQQAKVLSEKPFTLVAVNTSQENANDNCTFAKQDGNAETTGDTEVHSRLSYPQRLFPDDAGDWGSPGPDKSDRVRARRSPGKKRSAASRRKAQGSLFTGF
jgi:hypothetical protein